VLKAHGQATWNRSVRELGKSGTWVVYLVMGVAFLFGALPLFGMGLMLGYFGAAKLHVPEARALLGGVLAAIPLVGGTVSGVMGGTKTLTWESYRIYPLSLRQLFTAELVAGLGDPLPFLAGLTLLGTFLGFLAASPALAPLFLLVCAGSLLAMLLIQHLIGALGAVLVKRLQVALLLLGLLAWGGSVLTTLGGRPGRRGGSKSLDPVKVALVKRTLQRTVEILAWAPTTQAVRGLQELREGRPVLGLARQAPPFLLLALLGWAAARVLAWESGAEVLRVQAAKGAKDRLWSFTTPAGGLARLTWETLVGSHLGRFGFLIPLMSIVIIKGPASVLGGGGFWALPSAFAYLALTSGQLQFNQFGLDGHGVKALLLLPVSSRDLLKGKLYGLALYQGLQAALLMVLMVFVLKPSFLELAAGACLAGCFFLVQTLIGHWTSVWLPRPLPRDSLKNNGMPLLMVAVSLGTTLVNTAVFGGTWALCVWLAPGALLPAMAVLLVLCAVLYRALMPSAADFLDRHRERLLQALG
jgi:hypothetical protein